jgi:hypothetical protein
MSYDSNQPNKLSTMTPVTLTFPAPKGQLTDETITTIFQLTKMPRSMVLNVAQHLVKTQRTQGLQNSEHGLAIVLRGVGQSIHVEISNIRPI